MSDFESSTASPSPDELRQHPWLLKEAAGDSRLLELLVQREVMIDDVVEGRGATFEEHGPIYTAHDKIAQHKERPSTDTQ